MPLAFTRSNHNFNHLERVESAKMGVLRPLCVPRHVSA